MLVSAAKPACRKSFAADAASDHVSSRPVRGAIVWSETTPAAAHMPMQREHVEELAERLARAAVLDGLLVALVGLVLDEGIAQEARHLVLRDRA